MTATMRLRSWLLAVVAALACAAVFAPILASANNPIAVTSTGAPYKWNSFPVIYTVDGGTLGAFSNTEAIALTSEAFGKWTSVVTAALSIARNSVIGLGSDGDVNTLSEFDSVTSASSCTGTNPVIYDSDGAITNSLFGAGASASILGFAGLCAATTNGSILGMSATLNGAFVAGTPVSPLTRSETLAVIIHELGHALGLGHSQVNLNCLTDPASCPSNAPGGDIFGVPTMFPIALFQTESVDVNFAATLSADDVSAISTLYPKQPDFANLTGTIGGTVFFGDATNHFQGANVIARRDGDRRVTAVSNVSGMFAQVDHGNPALNSSPSDLGSPDNTKRGQYTIPGLPPGTYTVEVESVHPTFTGGSNVGPVGEQRGDNIPLPALAECFGGPESNADNATICETISLNGGDVFNGKDVILNDALATMDAFDSLSRNETVSTATVFAGASSASLSAENDSDVDVYSVAVPAGQVFTAQTQTVGWRGAVLEFTDSTNTTLNTCRRGDAPTPYNQKCVRTSPDAFSSLSTTSTGTVFVRVTDEFGDARPDFRYDVSASFRLPRAEVAVPPASAAFDSAFRGTSPQVKSITVTSIGSANMILSGNPVTVFTSGLTPGIFTLAAGSTCLPNLVLPPESSCTVNVGFQTHTSGQFAGGFEITSNTSPSSTVTFLVTADCVDFSVIPSSGLNARTVQAGQTASLGVNFVPTPPGVGLPTDTTFTVSGLPAGAQASTSPSSIAAGASFLAVPITISVTTTARSLIQPFLPRVPPYLLVWLLSILGMLAWRWQSWQQKRLLHLSASFVVLCVITLGTCGCGGGGGGGGGSGSGSGSGSVGTPAGTYPLTVTATSGPITHTTTVTLTVQ